jgi:hypothetical protein
VWFFHLASHDESAIRKNRGRTDERKETMADPQ